MSISTFSKPRRKAALAAGLVALILPVAAIAQQGGNGDHRDAHHASSNAASQPHSVPNPAPAQVQVQHFQPQQTAPQGWANHPTPQFSGRPTSGNWQHGGNGQAGTGSIQPHTVTVAPGYNPGSYGGTRSNGAPPHQGTGNWQGGNTHQAGGNWQASGGFRPGVYHGPQGNYRAWDHGWHNDSRYDWRGWRDYHRDVFHLGRYYPPYAGYYYSRLSVGFYLDPLFFGDGYWITDPWSYHLPPAYGPYHWVRYYDDAVLVDTFTGQVADVIYDFFW